MNELDQRLAAAARACSEDAVNRAFAAGLSVLVGRKGQLVRLYPDGCEVVEAVVDAASRRVDMGGSRPHSDAASCRVHDGTAPYVRPVRRFRLVAGPNGSGKSTLRARLSRDYAVNFYTL